MAGFKMADRAAETVQNRLCLRMAVGVTVTVAVRVSVFRAVGAHVRVAVILRRRVGVGIDLPVRPDVLVRMVMIVDDIMHWDSPPPAYRSSKSTSS